MSATSTTVSDVLETGSRGATGQSSPPTSQAKLAEALRLGPDTIVLVDPATGLIDWVSDRMVDLCGWEPTRLLGRAFHDLLPRFPVEPGQWKPMVDALRTGSVAVHSGRIRGLRRAPRPVEVRFTITSIDHQPVVVAAIREAEARSSVIARMQSRHDDLATRDPLTGLANRHHLLNVVGRTLDTTRPGDHVGLLAVDIAGFRKLNDSMGHDHGDEMLRQAAARITRSITPDATAARIGSDEFVIVLPGLGHDRRSAQDTAMGRAETVAAAIESPFRLGADEVQVSVRVGVAVEMSGSVEPLELLRRADLARRPCLESTGSSRQVFDVRMDLDAKRAMDLDRSLRRAIDRRELAVHLQPRLRVANGGLAGAEALLRWRKPNPANPDPASLVATAEGNGLIVPLGLWVLEETVGHAVDLGRAGVLRPGMSVSVNVSTHQLQATHFVDELAVLLDHAGLPPCALTVELTESSLLTDLHGAKGQLDALAELGVGLSIDDFGTGYSSLAYLRDLPVNELKLDRLFVSDLDRDAAAEAIVRGILEIARGTGLETVAEGVERTTQLDVLRATSCDQYQGHLTSAAVPIGEFLSRYGR